MNYVTYVTLIDDVKTTVAKLPFARDVVGVLGVPRSGMLPASIVAAELGVHLGDVDSFVRSGGAFMRPGRRMNWQPEPEVLGPHNSRNRGGDKPVVVVIDDSCHAAGAMDLAKTTMRSCPGLEARYKIRYGAVYITPGAEGKVHFWGRELEQPRLFEWNWRHHDALGAACLDMDGVICEDWTGDETKTPDKYREHVERAKPMSPIRRKIGWIVTSRLEDWRRTTEAWLEGNGVKYGELVMGPWKMPEERRSGKDPSGVAARVLWKADVYKKCDAKLFVESDKADAYWIRTLTQKPVLCPTSGEMYS